MTAADLRAFLRESLPAYMVPPHYVFLENLPLMANGKIDRKALPDPDWLGQRQSAAEDEPPSARDGIEAQLVKIWERVLGVHPIGLKDSFFELGGHSLLAVSLFAQMEKVFGRRLPLASLFQAPTVEQLAKLLRTKDLVPDWSPLVPIQPRGERPPFFAVHAYGGDVLFYRELARHLGEDQPFYGLQAVGLSGERHPLKRIDDMAARYLREVRAVQPEGPYRLGGYCMGAYVALEMARQLESEGQQAVLLVSFAADGSWKKANYLGAGIAMHLRTLARLNGLARASYIAWRLRFRLGRVRESLIDLYSKFLVSSGCTLPADLRHRHVRECHYQANLRYQAKSFSGAVTYFRPERAPTADPNGFWGEIARAGIEVHTVPGVDEDIFREPNVAELARRLRACLDRAQAPGALT